MSLSTMRTPTTLPRMIYLSTRSRDTACYRKCALSTFILMLWVDQKAYTCSLGLK